MELFLISIGTLVLQA